MNKIVLALIGISSMLNVWQSCIALHSDALIDWNEVIANQDNPFGSFESDIESVDSVDYTIDIPPHVEINEKKRKRFSDTHIDELSYLNTDPRDTFDAKKIIAAYQTYSSVPAHPKKVTFHCICAPERGLAICSDFIFERHFKSKRHTNYFAQNLTPSIAEQARSYITEHQNELFKTSLIKTHEQAQETYMKRSEEPKQVFRFDMHRELEKSRHKIKPVPIHCFCQPEITHMIHGMQTLLNHFKSRRHVKYKKTNAAAANAQKFEQQETELIKQVDHSFKQRHVYECICGSEIKLITVKTLKKHFSTKKHRLAIKYLKKLHQ